MSASEFLQTDLTLWEIGPYHPYLPGPLRLALTLDGEIIVSTEIEAGFLHKGLEKALERKLWQSSLAYSDHLDPEGAIFCELVVCHAVEELAYITAPPRAQAIRIILSELTRITCHLGYITRIARSVAADTMVHYVLRDRERLLDLFELLTGSRFSTNFLRFGGVRADVTEGFIERVLECCDMLRARLKEYNDLFTFNHTFKRRTTGVGTINLEWVEDLGISGPNARASGATFDARKSHPYSGYESVDFAVPSGGGGDCHGRFLQRLREIAQSVEILKQVTETIPAGDFSRGPVDKTFAPPSGEAYARVESARGLLGCHVVSDGGRAPARIQFSPPSLSHVAVLPRLLEGLPMEDLPVLLASLDIGVAEIDR